MKPDIMAFGGCDQHPIHLISPKVGNKVWSQGTSFASPIAASLAGRLVGESNNTIDFTPFGKILFLLSKKELLSNDVYLLIKSSDNKGLLCNFLENLEILSKPQRFYSRNRTSRQQIQEGYWFSLNEKNINLIALECFFKYLKSMFCNERPRIHAHKYYKIILYSQLYR